MSRIVLSLTLLLSCIAPRMCWSEETVPSEASSASRAEFVSQMQEALPSKIEVTNGEIKKIVLNGPKLFSNETVSLFCPSTSLTDFRGCCATERLDRKGIRKLFKSPNLEVLMIHTSVKLDSATLELVGELENLHTLYLIDAELEREGIGFLGRMKSLDRLVLSGTNVDDRSLQMLDALTLSHLDVGNTAVTREGVLRYCQQASPKQVHVGTSIMLAEEDFKLVAPTTVKAQTTSFLTIKLSEFKEDN